MRPKSLPADLESEDKGKRFMNNDHVQAHADHQRNEPVRRDFAMIDKTLTDEWLTYFKEDAHFRFGNSPPVTGTAAIKQSLAPLLSALKELHHEKQYEATNIQSSRRQQQ